MRKITRVGLAAVTAFVFSTNALADTATIGLRSEPSSMDPYFHNLGPVSYTHLTLPTKA